MLKNKIFLLLCLTAVSVKAQYTFSGAIDNEQWQNTVYLSLIEDYRKITNIYTEQIFHKTQTDSIGCFEFRGNELDNTNRIYRIHVDNCSNESQQRNHFDGHCKDSKSIIFIAKNNDSIAFPFSFDQMFCNIKSSNPKTNAFVKIDSLREDMKFAYGEFRSEANRKLNDKKWFKTFQEFGKDLNEPLAELYIYAFLSDRTSPHYNYYLQDLKSNTYYDDLLKRLKATYPNSNYTKQYEAELASDKFSITDKTESRFFWHYFIYGALALSLLGNVFLFLRIKKWHSKSTKDAKELLTPQEQKIVQLIVQDKSNKDIADALFVSVSTVKTHINNIYKKLNVQSREEVKRLF
uniref:response regulator transcription factor n=1 Tax=Gelidibacter sp. TaxID=2018083 RepID=UPI00404A2BF8